MRNCYSWPRCCARQMILQPGRWAAPLSRRVYVLGDNTYATYELLHRASQAGVYMIVRMRLDARLFHFPTPRPAKRRGPKPKVGKRQLPLAQRLEDGRIRWTSAIFSHWYGRKQKRMEFTSHTALWYKGGIPHNYFTSTPNTEVSNFPPTYHYLWRIIVSNYDFSSENLVDSFNLIHSQNYELDWG